MSAASTKSLAAVLAALVAILVIAGAASARDGQRRDRVSPSAPKDLRVTSATTSSLGLAWRPSTDNVGVRGYYVTVGGTRARVDRPTYTARRLSCGAGVEVRVVAFDRAGNRSGRTEIIASTAPCLDTEPPTAPAGVRQVATAPDAVVLAWDPAADNVGVVGYGTYRGGLPAGSTPAPTLALSGLSCGSTYAYEVDAVDASGNRSARTPVWVVTAACPDRDPPSTPTDLTVTARTTSSLSLEWDPASDNVGVTGYRVSVDGGTVVTVSGTRGPMLGSDGERTLVVPIPRATLSGLACGTMYVVAVEALDEAGNSSARATAQPATRACDQPRGDTARPSAPPNLSVLGATTDRVSLRWGASTDNVGVTGYDVYVDGGRARTETGAGATVTGLACGTAYLFGVEAYDAAGNRSPRSEVRSATAPCAAPTDTTRPSQPESLRVGTTTGASISLLWSAAIDNVAVTAYDVFRNGSAAATVTQPSANVTGLTCGTTHSFEVEARDAAGNRSTRAAVTASTSPCPDAQPPTAPAGVNATSRTATSIALSWSPSTDNVGVAGYGLYRGASRTTTTGTSWVVSGLTCNTNYTLSVDAFDASGNQSSRTTVMVATTACPDTAAPTAPSNLAVSGVTPTGLTLTWSASTDSVGVTGYDVYRNGTKVASGNTTSSTQSGLSCGTSYAFAVEALDAAGNRSGRGQLNASTGGCPPTPPPPPPPAGCAVNPATMTAPGCALKRDDTGVAANPEAGLWGQIGAASPSRHEHVTSGGDPHPRATGGAQGNSAFRRLTVQDGDDFFGARAELGRNTTTPYYTEATGTSTAGTFAVYREGERRITFWSQRYGTGFTATASNWQTVMQMKQQQPYAANGPVDSAPALEVQLYGGRVRLHSFWSSVWTTTAPVLGQWVRYAVDVTYSQDPAKGRVQMFVDANADGDFLDAGEVSPVLTMRTLAYVTSSGSSPIAPGGSLPSHLRLGIYHHSSYGTATVDLDNVQVVG